MKRLNILVSERNHGSPDMVLFANALTKKAENFGLLGLIQIISDEESSVKFEDMVNPTIIIEPYEFKKPHRIKNADKNFTAQVVSELIVNQVYKNGGAPQRLKVMIINRSELIGLPLSQDLIRKDFTVEVAHSKSSLMGIFQGLSNSDIIVLGTGQKLEFRKNNLFIFERKIILDISGDMKEYTQDLKKMKCTYIGAGRIGSATTKAILQEAERLAKE